MKEKANELKEEGKLIEASRVISEYYQKNKYDFECLKIMSEIALTSGNSKISLELFRKYAANKISLSSLEAAQFAGLLILNENLNEAKELLESALELYPDDTELNINYGALSQKTEDNKTAEVHFLKALSKDKNRRSIFESLANIKFAEREYASALEYFEKANSIEDGKADLLGSILGTKLHCASWDNIEALKEKIESEIVGGTPVGAPLFILATVESPSLQLAHNTQYALTAHPKNEFKKPAQRKHDSKIKIAYISPDFTEHAVSFLLSDLFRKHDRNRFEVIGVGVGRHLEGAYHEKIALSFDKFIDLTSIPESERIDLLLKENIDIAMDIGGYTAYTDTDLFAHKIGKIQVNYLGYPGTLGTPYHDAIIADDYLVPRSHEKSYSEFVIKLESGFQLNSAKPSIDYDRVKIIRDSMSCEVLYCCFAQPYKISPEIAASWSNILANVPEAKLLIVHGNNLFVDNIKTFFEKNGVDVSRILFAAQNSYADYLHLMAACDAYLDTFPFGGGACASDAIWANVPIVALSGDTFASRMAGSLMNTLGITETIVSERKDYESVAVRLGENSNFRSAIKTQMAENQDKLFDLDLRLSEYEDKLIEFLAERG